MRPLLLCMLVAWGVCLSGGCADAPLSPTEGTRVHIEEAYDEAGARKVTLSALLSPQADGEVQISSVSITVSPSDVVLVRKLETLLEDAAFRWRPGQPEWPVLARSVPAEALPMIRRLQLALLLLHGPPEFEVDCPVSELVPPTPSLGLTRVRRQGARITMASLALAMHADASTLGWVHADGTSDNGTFAFTGVRRIGHGSPQVVSMVIKQVHPTTDPMPAGR